jgi:hypothetical protein
MTEHDDIQNRLSRALVKKVWAVFVDQGLRSMTPKRVIAILDAINIISLTAAEQWNEERK